MFLVDKVRVITYLGNVVALAVKDGLCGQIWLPIAQSRNITCLGPKKLAAEDLPIEIGILYT